jgi:hypothetical protein
MRLTHFTSLIGACLRRWHSTIKDLVLDPAPEWSLTRKITTTFSAVCLSNNRLSSITNIPKLKELIIFPSDQLPDAFKPFWDDVRRHATTKLSFLSRDVNYQFSNRAQRV